MKPNRAFQRVHHLLSTIFLSVLLVACGGGGSSGGGNIPGGGSGGGTPSLSVANASIIEGDSGSGVANLTFTVTLSTSVNSDVTVDYATSDVSATAGSDYTATSGALTISTGSTTATVTVSVIGDIDIESNETLTLTLSNPVGATLGTATATGTINDDDSATLLPTVSVGDASVTEGNSGTSNLTFTITLSASASSDVAVDYATSDGSATAGSDYSATSGTLTISAGSTSGTVTVSVSGDADIESNETLILTLSNPISASLVTVTATGTILNDDSATPPPPPPGGSVSGLFYRSGSISLSMVDPANPSATPVLVETGNTTGEFGIKYGTFDSANRQITDIHIRTIFYVNTDDGRFYKISALLNDSQTPIQVSNETGAGTICRGSRPKDWADHNNSVYIYSLPGADASCKTFDDEWKMVRIGMDSNSSPITIALAPTNGLQHVAIHDAATGAISGFFARDGGQIVHCDQNFQNCSDVVALGDVRAFGPVIDAAILRGGDGKLYHYNTVTRTLSAPLHTFPVGTPSTALNWIAHDDANFYFADGVKLYKFPSDGSAPASLLTTAVASGEIYFITLTTNRVVYMVWDQVSLLSAPLESVSKSGGIPTTLSTPSDIITFPFFTAGEWVYYTGTNGSIAINEDGTSRPDIPNAWISGFIFDNTWDFRSLNSFINGLNIAKIVWQEGCSHSSGCGGGTLKAVDAATNSGGIVLGTIPLDIGSIGFVGTADRVLGGGGGLGSDIFYVNVNQAGSLQRITTTPAIRETVPFR